MPFASRIAAFLLLPLLAACAIPEAPSADPRLKALTARLPVELGGFKLLDGAPHPNQPNALGLRYAHAPSGTVALVGLITPDGTMIPDGPGSTPVELTVNILSLAAQASLGGTGLTRRPDFGGARTGQPPEVRCSDLQVRQADAAHYVVICATGIGGGIVTINMIVQQARDAGNLPRQFMLNSALTVVQALRSGATEASAAPAIQDPVYRL